MKQHQQQKCEFCIDFRQAMHDRQRAARCPSEMIDQIGGWSSGKVGERYAGGYELIQQEVELKKIVLNNAEG